MKRSGIALGVLIGALALSPAAAQAEALDEGHIPTISVHSPALPNPAGPDATMQFNLYRHGDLSESTVLKWQSVTDLENGGYPVPPQDGTVEFEPGQESVTVTLDIPSAAPGQNDGLVALVLEAPNRDAAIENNYAIGRVSNTLSSTSSLNVSDACAGSLGMPTTIGGVPALRCDIASHGNAHDVRVAQTVANSETGEAYVRFERPSGAASASATTVRAEVSFSSDSAGIPPQTRDVLFQAGQTSKIEWLYVPYSATSSDATINVTLSDSMLLGNPNVGPVEPVSIARRPTSVITPHLTGTARVGNALDAAVTEGTGQHAVIWQRCPVASEHGEGCVSINRSAQDRGETQFSRVLTAADQGYRVRAAVISYRPNAHGDRVHYTDFSDVIRNKFAAPKVSIVETTETGTATLNISSPEEATFRYRATGSSSWIKVKGSTVTLTELAVGTHSYEVQAVTSSEQSPVATITFDIPQPKSDEEDPPSEDDKPDHDPGPGTNDPAPLATLTIRDRDRRPAGSALRNRTHAVLNLTGKQSYKGRVMISKRLAKRLGLKSRTVATFTGKGESGRSLARIVFTKAAAKRLKAYRLNIYTTVTVSNNDGNTATGKFVLRKR